MILVGMVLGQSPRSSLAWSRVTTGISSMTLPPGELSLIFLKARVTPSCLDSCPQLVLPKKHHFSLEGCCPKLDFHRGRPGEGQIAKPKHKNLLEPRRCFLVLGWIRSKMQNNQCNCDENWT